MTAIETKCGTRAAGKLGQRGRQKSDTGFGDSRIGSANAASRSDVKSASTQ
ncbi:hypothetical protein SNOG_02298 [Parastagonospora nodorum SN15]|uniref:Uncharacterized protein n=1 Tax=Phaeosphaeria nodorum (strain SN15 / ATCC MYA-4574 / FGSC 10173) TaxID=321614 RepID=Q0V116_PHANO|nr:hypothetical protein SNOG_02298 [Parastagonospora nodorum SN15]EAT90510.1 hypothetical protein SNOG_02298 [Parastagonospora nodorum SN15]